MRYMILRPPGADEESLAMTETRQAYWRIVWDGTDLDAAVLRLLDEERHFGKGYSRLVEYREVVA